MKRLSTLSFFMMFCTLAMGAGRGPDTPAGSGLFGTDSLLVMTLLTDLDNLVASTEDSPEYQEAKLFYTDPGDSVPIEINIRVRTRGSFRRKPENCSFPPLKIKFDKTELQGSIFENLEDLKLVTHCQTDKIEFEQYVLEEYLIYKAYNVFTDYSFQVRLARINYVDIHDGKDTITRYAFFIENAGHMAERNDCDLLETETFSAEKLDQRYFTLMSLFNYMMLNTDYSVSIIHNVELLISDHFSPPIPVPYDFDWSGIINIPYDSPYALNKAKYPGRLYKGPCMKRKELEPTFTEMLSKRDLLFSLYREFPYLDEDLRSRCLQHLSMFYIIISSRELIRKEFVKKCDH